MEPREVTYLAVVLRILAAVIVGGILGLERGHGFTGRLFVRSRRPWCW